jgi:hypothetical protein
VIRDRDEAKRALAIFVGAAALRLLATRFLAAGAPIAPETDAVQYDELARAFLRGEWWNTPLLVREPGYPVFLALEGGMANVVEQSGQLFF